MESKKLYFLDILRVIATLSVFFVHIGLMFWVSHKTLQDLWQLPEVVWHNSFYISIIYFLEKIKLNFGSFGVAIFFLISGFTFLPSVNHSQRMDINGKMSRGGVFFLKKFFRIYPIYWCSVIITMSLVYYFRIGENFIYSWKDILVTMTLFRPLWSSVPSVDGISWYLECLVLFYIIGYFFNKYFPLDKFENIILLAILGLMFKTCWLYFSIFYIFIGLCFYNLYNKNFTVKQFICSVMLLVFVYYYKYKQFDMINFKSVFINYMYALGIFGFFYLLKSKHFMEKVFQFKFIRIISTLSFPIYLIHGVCSYVIMSVVYQIIPSWFVCVGVSVLWTLIMATVLHYVVENPMKNIAKKVEGI